MFERLLTSFQNIFKIPELRTRILFTMGMLVVYRIGAHIPTPGINGDALSEFLQKEGGALLGFLDIFSGGSLSRLTIFALGIMPYISASIILQLLTVVVPHLTKLAKEGERGRKKIIQYTRFGTIGIALIQGFGIAVGLEQMNNGAFVMSAGWGFRLMTVITLTAGTGFLMWLGEQITERGIGNGISLIIFAGIVARLPAAVAQTFDLYKVGQLSIILLAALAVLMVVVVAAIVFLGKRATENAGSVCKAGHRTTSVRRAEHAYSTEDQYRGRDSAYFRIVDYRVSCDDCRVFRDALGEGLRRAARARIAVIYPDVCWPYFVFLFLLYRRGLEPGGYGGQYEEVRWIHSRDSPWDTDFRLHLQGTHENYVCRIDLSRDRMCDP